MSALVAPGAAQGARPLNLPPRVQPDQSAHARTPARADGQPEAQAPRQVRSGPAPVRRQAPTRRLEPGDLICPDCGEGNPETRRFCSRCGASLVDAVVMRAKWWRKLIPRRGPRVREAGARPSQRRVRRSLLSRLMSPVMKTVRNVIALIMLVSGIVFGIVPTIRSEVNDKFGSVQRSVRNWVSPNFSPVHATQVRANAHEPKHGSGLAVDGFKNTYWSAPTSARPALVLTFDHEVNLARLIIHSGNAENFEATGRPQKLHLVFSTGQSTDLNLKDTPDPQTLDVSHGKGVASVEIHAVSFYRSITGRDVAVAELEFFRKE